jgi:integral membrane protein (TIGR01906 family)
MNKVIPVVKALTGIAVVVFVLLTSLRFLFSPLFLRIEYSMPGFPQDDYGFTKEERLKWANISLTYLLNRDPIDLLAQHQLADGEALYNERELQHMLDVKNLVSKAMITWYISIALLILFGLFANEAHFLSEFWQAFSKGGIATVVLIVVIIFGVLASFEWLFTVFHRIFFEGDTWLFSYSDTLIRLFPMRFWSDAFVFLGILAAVFGVIAFVVGRVMRDKILKGEFGAK